MSEPDCISLRSEDDENNDEILDEKDDFKRAYDLFFNRDKLINVEEDINHQDIYQLLKKPSPNKEIKENTSIIKAENLQSKGEKDKKIDSIFFTDKNKFKVYKMINFNVFHPGGNTEYYKKIRDEIDNQNGDKNKNNMPVNKFNVFKNNKKVKKKAKEKKKRKDKPDDIRKKIKARFLKITKNRINEMLKIAKSKEFFDFFPQSFISNISKKSNHGIIYMTFKEIMSLNYLQFYNSNKETIDKTGLLKKKRADKKKYEKNKKVLSYLEKNEEICKMSKFDVISEMTFAELFEEYLKSEEFEKEIENLKLEENSENYIKNYVKRADTFIEYFSQPIEI